MSARSHSRILRRPTGRRSIRTPQRDCFNGWDALDMRPPWLVRTLTLADVLEDES